MIVGILAVERIETNLSTNQIVVGNTIVLILMNIGIIADIAITEIIETVQIVDKVVSEEDETIDQIAIEVEVGAEVESVIESVIESVTVAENVSEESKENVILRNHIKLSIVCYFPID